MWDSDQPDKLRVCNACNGCLGGAVATLLFTGPYGSRIFFDPHRPYQQSVKFPLIRLPLLTGHPSIFAQTGGVLRPFCAQLFCALLLLLLAMGGCGIGPTRCFMIGGGCKTRPTYKVFPLLELGVFQEGVTARHLN